MRCLAIRHLKFEDLGTFEEVLMERGFDICYIDAGLQPMDSQDWDRADLVVVLGGPIGVYEVADYPWLRDEISFVERRLRQDLPTLGICLGAQLIAAALGAKVYPGKAKEIGWSTLQLSTAAMHSCLRYLSKTEVLHWHGDTFDLPEGANLLASTDLTPHQAFSYGRNTLALQFHVEAHGERIEPWLIGHTTELRVADIDIQHLRSDSLHRAQHKAMAGQDMLCSWLQQVRLS